MLYTGLVFSPTGYDFANTNTGLAVSDDGFHWIKPSDQPVLTGTPDGWDASGPFTLDWLETKDQLRLVYVSGGKVGVASAPIDVAPVELTENKLSAELVLLQNYPNPFNAETTITYHLPQALEVEIYIFNLQGQKVNTLVKSIRPAGLQKINWQGTDETGLRVAGGVYLCQLKSALFVRTKKMLLLP
jgi:hypothetical protein